MRQAAAATLSVTGLALTGGTVLHGAVTGASGAPQAAPSAVTVAEAQTEADAAERADAAAAANRATRQTPGTPSPAPSTTPPARAANPAQDKPSPTPTTAKPAWVDPMPDGRTTSCFGRRWGRLHAGIDLAAASGTTVRAAGAGTVVTAGSNYGGYGLSVLVDHGNGFYTHYAHLSRVSVAAGDRVTAGQRIGAEGSTGNSTGPHLHFEVHDGRWNQVDPAAWMASRGVDLGC
ncbi:M23 family metallopeptidase [Catenuloplanes atrovinosus]|uniref:M23 family metallopeptidase n=1 Tax=Catenuloplanes atrovinosus TaxID=137266 RepID=UPI0035B53FF9